MDNATKKPWKFGKTFDDTKIMILDGSGDYVCSVQIEQTPRSYGRHDEERRKTNAALIVTAVNQHAALLRCAEALVECEDLFEALLANPSYSTLFRDDMNRIRDHARASLSALEQSNGG